ncbi:ATPase/DNA packaging protein [Microcoleus sp. herbarium19]|uniref:ATPase/DNA packaging protein n=1 Tax=Microcoleus sp. herbarium19 TaxID=3055440 RepID=UPI002FD22F71
MKDKRLVVKPIPVPSANKHPPPPNDVLPNHEFTIGIIAPKGSGKTTVIGNLLDFYKGYFHTILVFSPTVNNDDKWDWIKNQKLISQNKPLIKWVKSLENKNDPYTIVQPLPASHEIEQLVKDTDPDEFDGKIPEECFRTDYDESNLVAIMEEQNAIITLLKKHGKPKHLANRILIVFDDMVGSTLFSSKKESPFKRLNTNHRHYSTSILMVSQGYMEIPKTVRTQYSCLIAFEISNEREVQMIFEEHPMNFKKEMWWEMYHHCTEGDHDFMFINYQKPKRLRIMKNFLQYVFNKNEK